MMRSMFAGVSGLRQHQVKMDVLGNNIANVNTQGFKASRVSFSEMFNQTVSSASAPSANLGGRNPKQVGLGVSTGAIDVLFTTGNTQSTGRTLDLCIEGDGFFAVKQGEQTSYTRAGNLYLDETGFLITSSGQFVQGVYILDEELIGDETYDGLVTGADAEEVKGVEYDFNENPDSIGRILIPLNFTNISFSADGVISGMSPDGNMVDIAVIPLANFVNAAGLERTSDNLYIESKNSGTAQLAHAGQGGSVGDLKSGALEMSNVDLSEQFTDMIITQRGFQANSRVITVSDTLLEELINLKR